MNFCYQPINVENNNFVFVQPHENNSIRNDEMFQKFEENCTKIMFPNSVIRSSSLSKISQCTKNLIQKERSKESNQMLVQNSHLIGNKQIGNKINSNLKTQKNSIQKNKTNVKQVIFNKLLQKNQVINKYSQNQQDKENHNQKQKLNILNCNLLSENFYHKHQNVNKLLQIYKQNADKQLKQCTFNPKTNSINSQRNLDSKEFYNQQLQYYKKTQYKIQQIRALIEKQKSKENTFKPKISSETSQLTQRRAQINVYQRLYSQNHKEDKFLTQRQDSFNKQLYHQSRQIRRNTSKKTLSIVSTSKKKINLIQNDSQRKLNQQQQSQNKQKGIKKFTQFLNQKQSKYSQKYINKKCENINFTHKIFERNLKSKENLQKKKIEENHSNQLLDCRQLMKQKQQRSNKLLFRQKSSKALQNKKKEIDMNKKMIINKVQIIKQKSLQKNKAFLKNQRIVIEKFIKEFTYVAKIMKLSQHVSLEQMLQFMNKMNFIQNLQQFYGSSENKQTNKSYVKFYELWQFLQGSVKNHIFIMNLFKFLCAVLGFHKASIIDDSLRSNQQACKLLNQQNKSEKLLILSQKDSQSLKKDFINFYLIRFKLGQTKLIERQQNIPENSFRPTISKQSEQFAQKYRQRILLQGQKLLSQGVIDFEVPQDGMINHSTLLILDQKIKRYKLQKMREQAEIQKRKMQDESMGGHFYKEKSQFSQRLSIQNRSSNKNQNSYSNIYSRISHNQSQSKSKDQIFVELYENGIKSKNNKRNKSVEYIQYEEAKNELTFKPKINTSKSNHQNNQIGNFIHQNIPNFAKQVMRIRKNRNSLQAQNMEVSPLLYLNITMEGNQSAKIPVYSNESFSSLTEKIRVLMNIQNGEEQKKKLSIILKNQIIPALDKLGIKHQNGEFFQIC